MPRYQFADRKSLPWPNLPVSGHDMTNASVVIIGGGFSGMCLAISLLKQNFRNFVIIEKSSGFGGTWRDSRFPGSCCDVFSHLYSYSFENSGEWSRVYGSQEEILNYLMGVAQKHELYRYVRFNSEVDSSAWDETDKKWKTRIQIAGGKESEYQRDYTISSDFLVSAVGQLNSPNIPQFSGLEQYQGRIMHSARWDWSTPIQDRRVCVIGTGATAAQIVPEVAKIASHLTVAQRSPAWVIPRNDHDVPGWQRFLLSTIPAYRSWHRTKCMDIRESFFNAVTHADTPLADVVRHFTWQKLQNELPGRPDLHEKLYPKYDPGCKRAVLSDDFFPALGQENTVLETRRIDKFTEKGILFEGDNEATEFDVVVMATGYKSKQFMYPISVKGVKGEDLESVWANAAEAYKGVSVEALPNFGIMYGPGTNLVHNSIVLHLEAQARYLTTIIQQVAMARYMGGWLKVTPRRDVLKSYNDWLQKELGKTSFADPKCSSWWKDEKTGKIVNNWPKNAIEYQELMSEVDWTAYTVEGPKSADLELKRKTHIGRVQEESSSYARIVARLGTVLLAVGGASGLVIVAKNALPLLR